VSFKAGQVRPAVVSNCGPIAVARSNAVEVPPSSRDGKKIVPDVIANGAPTDWIGQSHDRIRACARTGALLTLAAHSKASRKNGTIPSRAFANGARSPHPPKPAAPRHRTRVGFSKCVEDLDVALLAGLERKICASRKRDSTTPRTPRSKARAQRKFDGNDSIQVDRQNERRGQSPLRGFDGGAIRTR
jgi:hypothetical protein